MLAAQILHLSQLVEVEWAFLGVLWSDNTRRLVRFVVVVLSLARAAVAVVQLDGRGDRGVLRLDIDALDHFAHCAHIATARTRN